MNTWTDSGLSEAGMIGAMLAVGVEARLPDGPARSRRGGSRRLEDRRADGRSSERERGDGRRTAAEPIAQPPYRDAGAPQDALTRSNGSGPLPREDVPQRSGRRRAAEPAVASAGDRGLVALGVPAADHANSYADSYGDRYSGSDFGSASGFGSGADFGSGSHAAVEPAAVSVGPDMPSSLTGSFPMTGVARLQTPAPVPLPSEPLPPEPEPVASASSVPSSVPSSSNRHSSDRHSSDRHGSDRHGSDRHGADLRGADLRGADLRGADLLSAELLSGDRRNPTDGFLAGGFSSSSTDSPWDSGTGSSGLSGDLSGSWSRPVPITPQSPLDAAVSAPTTMVREPYSAAVSAAVSAPTSLLPMPKTPASHHAESLSTSDFDEELSGSHHSSRETFNVESNTLGSLDSSGLFAALSRRG